MGSAKTALLMLLFAVGLSFAAYRWTRGQKSHALGMDRRRDWWFYRIGIGLLTDFLDTLGVGSFATTSSLFRIGRLVADEQLPGTMNVGHALPTITQALIYIAAKFIATKRRDQAAALGLNRLPPLDKSVDAVWPIVYLRCWRFVDMSRVRGGFVVAVGLLGFGLFGPVACSSDDPAPVGVCGGAAQAVDSRCKSIAKDTCGTCQASYCCNQLNQCAVDTGCMSYVDCVNACTDDTCITTCTTSAQAADLALFLEYVDCIDEKCGCTAADC
jgi:hypothetical protein